MRKRNSRTNDEVNEFMERWDIEYTWLDKLLHPFIWVWMRVEADADYGRTKSCTRSVF